MAVETRLRHKDGTVIQAVLKLSLINPHDLSAGVIVTGIDVSPSKGTENRTS